MGHGCIGRQAKRTSSQLRGVGWIGLRELGNPHLDRSKTICHNLIGFKSEPRNLTEPISFRAGQGPTSPIKKRSQREFRAGRLPEERNRKLGGYRNTL